MDNNQLFDGNALLESNPPLKEFAERIAGTLRMAADKAVAHFADPQQFPMPPGADSLEDLFLSRFTQLPVEQQQKVIPKVLLVMSSPQERVERYGELAGMSMTEQISLAEQAQALPLSD